MAENIDFDSHRRAAQAEDIAWLLRWGVPLADACKRVGVSLAAWEKRNTPSRKAGTA